jgi:Bacterial sugar transferase
VPTAASPVPTRSGGSLQIERDKTMHRYYYCDNIRAGIVFWLWIGEDCWILTNYAPVDSITEFRCDCPALWYFRLWRSRVKIDRPGAIFYQQERVGQDGARFTVGKFRSTSGMVRRSGRFWVMCGLGRLVILSAKLGWMSYRR